MVLKIGVIKTRTLTINKVKQDEFVFLQKRVSIQTSIKNQTYKILILCF